MEVTALINKIKNDYQNIDLLVNSALKYRFHYNGYETAVFYTTINGLQNQLSLIITVNGIDYLTTLYFSHNDEKQYYMNYYLPPELYNKVKFTLLFVDHKCNTKPYFEKMSNAIINNNPIPSNYVDDINQKNLYKYKQITDNPYFETTVRKKMSPEMKKKIFIKYNNDVANKIIKYCGNTLTLRFTSDISRSKDILTYINKTT